MNTITRRLLRFLTALGTVGAIACQARLSPTAPLSPDGPGDVPEDTPVCTAQPAAGRLVPITELGACTYLGFAGGLYQEGTNTMPTAHAALGMQFARSIRPRDASGQPNATGKYVLLSVGMSNTTQEFCGGNVTACAPASFVGQALADPRVDRTHLVIVDGAQGGRPIRDWVSPASQTYNVVRDQRLAALGVTEAQVQIVWVKQANPRPTVSLPAPDADAYAIVAGLGAIARSLKVRYPNVQIAFLSSRIYAGYAPPGTLNPEPFAYESAFAVKWVIAAQIRQVATGEIDPRAGDLAPGVAAPWLAWGPYLWANGSEPRADGLVWLREDFQSDATHPGPGAQRKVGSMLLAFLTASPHASCWFLTGATC